MFDDLFDDVLPDYTLYPQYHYAQATWLSYLKINALDVHPAVISDFVFGYQ